MNIDDEMNEETCILSSVPETIIAKFSPKYERPREVIEVIGQNFQINKNESRYFVNIDQVYVYKDRALYPERIHDAQEESFDDVTLEVDSSRRLLFVNGVLNSILECSHPSKNMSSRRR